MNSHFIFNLRIISLSILLSIFVSGIMAQNNAPQILVSDENSPTQKNLQETNYIKGINLVTQDELDITEEKQKLEDWMFDCQFWQLVKKFEWDQEPVEETRLIEEWMLTFKIQLTGRIDVCSDFTEKEWMKKHSFFIL